MTIKFSSILLVSNHATLNYMVVKWKLSTQTVPCTYLQQWRREHRTTPFPRPSVSARWVVRQSQTWSRGGSQRHLSLLTTQTIAWTASRWWTAWYCSWCQTGTPDAGGGPQTYPPVMKKRTMVRSEIMTNRKLKREEKKCTNMNFKVKTVSDKEFELFIHFYHETRNYWWKY